MTVLSEVRCPHCGAPIKFNPGEILATCSYCGYISVVETGKPFDFAHSMILNEMTPEKAEGALREWMRTGFLKPSDLERRSKILEESLNYLPFWVVSMKVKTDYRGVFERLSPPIVKEGKIERKYDWLVLARKATDFPTREYEVPLEGKVIFDFRRVEGYAKVLNSEVGREEAVDVARQQVEDLHRFLIRKEVDRVIEFKTKVDVGDVVYLHAPVWFLIYEYKGKRYRVLLDGASGKVIKGDLPPVKFI